MANGIRTGDLRSSKVRVGSRVRQTPEEGRRTYRPKRCGNNNKDENNSLKTLNDKNSYQGFNISIFNNNKDEENCPKTLNYKNHQASFQKFRRFGSYGFQEN